LRILLPAEYNAIRVELERQQREKEDAVANQEWERAVELRDETDALKAKLRQAPQETIDLQPNHILQALANLGFDEPIIV